MSVTCRKTDRAAATGHGHWPRAASRPEAESRD